MTLVCALVLQGCTASDITIESFSNPSLTWKQQNDPVMGGRSTGTFSVQDGVGVFDGQVVDVPSLKAPGFIQVNGDGSFPDISSCSSLVLTVQAAQAYAGYRVSFGKTKAPGGKFFAYGYKSHFDAPVGEFADVTISLKNFSDYWDDATGDIIKTCQDNEIYCPDTKTLKDMQILQIWAEGKAGDVHLQISQIRASGCTEIRDSVTTLPSTFNSTCSAPVQSSLRYNLSHTDAAQDWTLPLAPGEDLSSAVCCDAFYKPYAEPQHMFARKDVDLFSYFKPNVTVTFYDSVCGLPLFVVPRGRSLEDFFADTTEHGWPSFRPEELVPGNSHIVDSTGEVVSACGTHLGSFLPDARGARWCLDLSCISGNPAISGSVRSDN